MRRNTMIASASAVLVVVVASVVVMSRHAPTRWYSTYGSSDAAAVNQDNQILVSDLALPPGPAASHLRYDCGIGLRDLTRVLSHPQPPDQTLRRLYRRALIQNATTYRTCERVFAPGGGASPTNALVSVRTDVRRLARDESAVNGRARVLGLGTLLLLPAGAPSS